MLTSELLSRMLVGFVSPLGHEIYVEERSSYGRRKVKNRLKLLGVLIPCPFLHDPWSTSICRQKRVMLFLESGGDMT